MTIEAGSLSVVSGGSFGVGGAVEGSFTGAAPISSLGLSRGPSFGAVPGIGSLESAFGRVMGFGDISPVVNEGPVTGFNQTEFTTLHTFAAYSPPAELSIQNVLAQAEGLIQAAKPPVLNTQEVLAEANYWLGDPAEDITEPMPIISPKPVEIIVPRPFLENSSAPVGRMQFVEVEELVLPTVATSQVVRPKPNTGLAPFLVTETSSPVSIPELREVVETQDPLAERLDPTEDPKSDEEEQIEKDFYLEDEQVSKQRIVEIRQALVKAKSEANKLGIELNGKLVAKFLPAEHPGNRSQIVKKQGPDGSFQETVDAIAQVGKLQDQPEKVFNQIVEENKPVKFGGVGRRVGIRDIVKVLKYKVTKIVASEVVVKRVTKKINQGAVVQVSEQLVNSEPEVADYPQLAEVFKV